MKMAVLVCSAVWTGMSLPVFQRSVPPPSPGRRHKGTLPLQKEGSERNVSIAGYNNS
jgi:hypothetical protein